MANEACRACDGRGTRKTEDRENVFRVTVGNCSRCNGSGREPGPPKPGAKRFGRRRRREDEDDNDLGRAADRFLARHGFGRLGR